MLCQKTDGTQSISSTCIDCPVGYFREGEAEGEEANECQACPAMTQPTEIETDETADDAIDRRSYLEGACKNCQAGERSSGGSELCSNCPANTYLNHIESFNTDELIWDVDDCNACDGGGTSCLKDLTGCRECKVSWIAEFLIVVVTVFCFYPFEKNLLIRFF